MVSVPSQKSKMTKILKHTEKVTRRLSDGYGSPRHGNYSDPTDELFYIILSQMTTGPSFRRVFERLKSESVTWDRLTGMRLGRLKRIIGDAGLSNQKAPRLKEIARRLRREFGYVTLTPLSDMDDHEVEAFLTSLPGVGTKTAKCVMMYALGRQVLPVDTHVWRLSKRLGLIDRSVPYHRVHKELEAVVAPELRYDFHVNALSHGREVCRAIRPNCQGCILADLCPSCRK